MKSTCLLIFCVAVCTGTPTEGLDVEIEDRQQQQASMFGEFGPYGELHLVLVNDKNY